MDNPRFNRRGMLVAGGAAFGALTAISGVARAAGPRPDIVPALRMTAKEMGEAGQPGSAFSAIDKGLAATVGHKLFTILVVNQEKGENQRYYSNRPKEYPTGSGKPLVKTSEAYKMAVEQGVPRILLTPEEMRRAFFDYELILSMGCESCINYPIRWDGRTIGTLNLLHEKDWYSRADFPDISVFAAMAVPAVLEVIKRW